MYRLIKIFHPMFWRSVAEAFRSGVDDATRDR